MLKKATMKRETTIPPAVRVLSCRLAVAAVVGAIVMPLVTGSAGSLVIRNVARAESAGDSAVALLRPDGTQQMSGSGPHAAAITFARQHHPELAELLGQLRQGDPRAFAEAVADIERALDRLEKLRDRQPERYASALEEWRLSSRIQLVLARLAISKDPLLEVELADLVRQRQDVRLAQLRAERERMERRIEKIGAMLAEHDADANEAVERECRELVRRARKATDGTAAVRKNDQQRDGNDNEGGAR
jgi:hypothetical protein